MLHRRKLVFGWLVTFLGCAGTQAFDYGKEPDPRRDEFVIGVSDLLRINVWQMPDLSVDARVRPDGTVTMPLIGDLSAAGRTPSALRGDIEARLKSFVKDDSNKVAVGIVEVNSYRFTVAGNVEHAGIYNANRFVTVTEALAMAGGPSRFGSPTHTVIIRPSSSGPRRIPVNLDAIYSGEHPEMNVVIISGDTIHVP